MNDGYSNSMLYDWEWVGSERRAGQRGRLVDFLAGIKESRRAAQRPSSFCPTCNDFRIGSEFAQGADAVFEERYDIYNRMVQRSNLESTAAGGCMRCKILQQAILLWSDPGAEREFKMKILPTSIALSTSLSCFEIFACAGEPCRAVGFPSNGKGRARFPALNAETGFEPIMLAIHDCIRNHTTCNPPTTSIWPNRLVEIPDEDGLPVRVVKTPPGGVQYTAFSHCWGKGPLLRLLQHHGDGNSIEFAWDDLPCSFRDACRVSRYLFQKYVWIDSLCIVQDDDSDWEVEAAKMGAIYQGAYVTISAVDANGSAEGFLFPRFQERNFTYDTGNGRPITRLGFGPTPLVRFTTREYDSDIWNSKFFYYGDTPDHEWMMRPVDLGVKYMNPLQLRGWGFQERLLSKRVLHFKRYEVLLECNQGFRCECGGFERRPRPSIKSFLEIMGRHQLTGQDRIKARQMQRDLFKPLISGAHRTLPRLPQNVNERLLQTWEMIVEAYTRTSFTYSEDILPALGSLAREFNRRRPDWTYLAGIWKENIPRSLLWVPESPQGRQSLPAKREKEHNPTSTLPKPTQFAPSFSWVSMKGRIRYKTEELDGTCDVQVIDAEVHPIGHVPDIYGDISTGYITLRGKAVAFRFPKYTPSPPLWDSNEFSILVYQGGHGGDCERDKQDIQICYDIDGDEENWVWEEIDKVGSGMETTERVKGFDNTDEFEDYFKGDLLGTGFPDEENKSRAVHEPLFVLRLTSNCYEGIGDMPAAVLMLRKCSESPVAYRRVGLRVLENQIFDGVKSMDIRIH